MWNLESLIHHASACQTKLPSGEWVPARPITFGYIWRYRIKDAWAVLIGKADAVKWPGDQ